MALSVWSRSTALIGVAILVAGCRGQTGNPVPQGATAQARVHRASGSSGDLLYISTKSKILMMAYPGGQLVGSIPTPTLTQYLCSDPNSGNVFVRNFDKVTEYAHGGTTPIGTLNLPTASTGTGGCSIDPTTGNLAVGIGMGSKMTCGVLVYANAQGSPSYYTAKHLKYCPYTAYDGSGNLFLSATTDQFSSVLMELRHGESNLTRIKLNVGLCLYYCTLQWEGEYLVFRPYNGPVLYLVAVSGSSGTLVSQIQLESNGDTFAFYIKKGFVFSFGSKLKKNNNEPIGVWVYPAGGRPTKTYYNLTHGRRNSLEWLTDSEAHSPQHIRK